MRAPSPPSATERPTGWWARLWRRIEPSISEPIPQIATAELRQQHERLRTRLEALRCMLSHDSGGLDATQLHQALNELRGLLGEHFIAEDYLLYPALLHSESSEVAKLARQFQAELGCLAQRFERFCTHWSGTEKIRASPAAFNAEGRVLIEALLNRITLEDQTLYSAADRCSAARRL